MNFKIRAAQFHDLDRLSQLFDGYRVYYKQPSDRIKAKDFIGERLANRDSSIFVAHSGDEQLLGFVQLYPIFSSVSASKSLLLNDLYVAQSARRLGVARQLMHHAKGYAQSQGTCWVMLQTEKTNIKAQKLYESLGFIKDEDCHYYYLSTNG